MQTIRMIFSEKEISLFHRLWNVTDFTFGSVLTEELNPENNITVLSSFSEQSKVGFFELA